MDTPPIVHDPPTSLFTFIGNLQSGEAIFRCKDGSLAIERDHEFLAYPTAAETSEVYEIFPQLKPS